MWPARARIKNAVRRGTRATCVRPRNGTCEPARCRRHRPSLTAHAQSRADEDQGESTKCAVPIAPSPPLVVLRRVHLRFVFR